MAFGKISQVSTQQPPPGEGPPRASLSTRITVDFPQAAGPSSSMPVRIWSMEYICRARDMSSEVACEERKVRMEIVHRPVTSL